jgi:hypothetical protein
MFFSFLTGPGANNLNRLSPGSGPLYKTSSTQVSLYTLADNADVTDGVYRIGIACFNNTTAAIDGTPGGQANFWDAPITITNHVVTSPGNGTFDWSYGSVPSAPTLDSPLTAGDAQISGSFAPVINAVPPVTKYTVRAHPQSGGGPDVTQDLAAAGSFTLTPLTNGVTYDVSVTATSDAGTSPPSNVLSATPASITTSYPAPGLTAAAGVKSVTLTWTPPAGDTGRTGYTIFSSTIPGFAVNLANDATTYTVTGLTAGVSYSFTIQAAYPAPVVGTRSGAVSATPLPPGVNPVTPNRVFDTRSTNPQGAVTITQKRIGGSTELKVKVTGESGVPADGVDAVALNVTAVNPDGPGYLTVYPCGTRPNASNLNYVAGQIVPNSVIAPVSADGSVCIYSLANTDVIADVSGWFGASAGFTAVTPNRVFETRTGNPQGAVPITQKRYGGSTELKVKVTGQSGVPAGGVGAVALNVTAINPDGPGYVTVYPCGTKPNASNLNYVAGQIVPNTVIAPVSSDGSVCFYSLVNTDLIADVSGWFASGSGFNAVTPNRVFDTRAGNPQGAVTITQKRYGGATELKVQMTGQSGVPASGVGAVSLNVTAINPDGSGYVTVYPCGTKPTASNLNYVAGQIVPNTVIAPVSSDGSVCFYSLVNTDLIADVSGYFIA